MSIQDMPQTGRKYSDGTPVPFPATRCKSHAKETKTEGRTHYCKHYADHEGDHSCICGKPWQTAKKEDA